jgi:hypothetical protein
MRAAARVKWTGCGAWKPRRSRGVGRGNMSLNTGVRNGRPNPCCHWGVRSANNMIAGLPLPADAKTTMNRANARNEE